MPILSRHIGGADIGKILVLSGDRLCFRGRCCISSPPNILNTCCRGIILPFCCRFVSVQLDESKSTAALDSRSAERGRGWSSTDTTYVVSSCCTQLLLLCVAALSCKLKLKLVEGSSPCHTQTVSPPHRQNLLRCQCKKTMKHTGSAAQRVSAARLHGATAWFHVRTRVFGYIVGLLVSICFDAGYIFLHNSIER